MGGKSAGWIFPIHHHQLIEQDAVTALADPAITSLNFTSSIILTLATLVSPPSRSCSLIHSFLLSQPASIISTPTETDIYTVSLASASSVSNAFGFIRASPVEDRQRLREVVWTWALGSPRTPCGSGNHTVPQSAIKEILHLPLLPDEDNHLLQFLLHPPKSIRPESLSLLHDLVTLRLIHQGKYAESLQLDKELAGSGGKEEDRQRRREMVREFIGILPEVQRRALNVDSEATAQKREKERLVNGFVRPQSSAEMDDEEQDAEEILDLDVDMDHRTMNGTADINIPRPHTPSMQSQIPISRNVSSPFTGPPRFAPTPLRPSSPAHSHAQPIQRVLSGSPFTLPMSRGASAVGLGSGSRTPLPLPKPRGKPIVNDDEEERKREEHRARSRSRQVSKANSLAASASAPGPSSQQQQDGPDGHTEEEGGEDAQPARRSDQSKELDEPSAPRRSQRVVSNSHPDHEPASKPSTPPPASEHTDLSPPPPPPTTARRRTRQSTAPLSESQSHSHTQPQKPKGNSQSQSTGISASMPGSFASVPENDVAPEPEPASPTTSRRSLSVAPDHNQPSRGRGGSRSRMTRSASRALLDDHEENGDEESRESLQPATKRTRRRSGASEMSDMTTASNTHSVRRSTRKRTGGVGQAESEMGSPTPSVSTTASRRRKEGSATPRAVRTKRR